MAEKEATVYIVDVGASMGERHNGRDELDLDWAMHYVWDKITSTVATGRKTATVGVLGLRTDGTANELGGEESFQHISVLQPISQLLMSNLRELRSKIRLSGTDSGDAISALVIAIQMIATYTKKLKYKRKIVLITNGREAMDTDDMDEITKKLKQDNIELIILGVDFDDAEFGFKEEGKDRIKAQNEASFKALADDCDGVFGTLEQAISELGLPRIKPVRPVPSYKGQLTLGNPGIYDSAMSIDVERYPRTKFATVPSASQFADPGHGQGSTQSSMTIAADGHAVEDSGVLGGANGLIAVKSDRVYMVEDGTPGVKREVEREELAKGYEYGRTAVHISEPDENVTKLETKAGLELIGFVPREKYERYMNMSVASVIIAQKTNDKASMALSSLVHALFELDSYGIARLVTKDDVAPVILLLGPSIEAEFECLVDVQLPFAEDVRSYRFPPLDRVVTVSGKVLKEHRNLPSDRLNNAMSDFVDQMDLATFDKDENGKPAEFMAMEDTFSPVLHRIDQAVRWRAVHPSDRIPPPYDILTKYSKPPQELVEASQARLEELQTAADIKKVPPKVKGRKRDRDRTQPMSGLNVDELLGREKRTKITAENAIPEFKQMLALTEDPNAINDASKQMSKVIYSQIEHSLGDSGYGQAIEGMRVMREELIALEEPAIFNDFVRDLKQKLLAGELGGDRREMWWEIRKTRLGLIDKKQSDVSEATEEEAKLVSCESFQQGMGPRQHFPVSISEMKPEAGQP
ncbi:MAG: ATP-dependent DNA helicase II subunit 2 [Thelocarpon impressellum]|nr:MAG: ATP-dependent DNA helicase II subunit 2 [Thelocarpon impressellum]